MRDVANDDGENKMTVGRDNELRMKRITNREMKRWWNERIWE